MRELVPVLLGTVRPVLNSCRETTEALATLIPENQFWRWKDMWSNSIRTVIYAAALVEFLSSGTLITLPQVNELLGSEHLVMLRFKHLVDVP